MLTGKVSVTTAATNLKTLLEISGVVFPDSGNDKCSGIILQLDPEEGTESVMVLSAGATEGPTLVNDTTFAKPSTIAFRVDAISRVFLKASANTPDVFVLVEHD